MQRAACRVPRGSVEGRPSTARAAFHGVDRTGCPTDVAGFGKHWTRDDGATVAPLVAFDPNLSKNHESKGAISRQTIRASELARSETSWIDFFLEKPIPLPGKRRFHCAEGTAAATSSTRTAAIASTNRSPPWPVDGDDVRIQPRQAAGAGGQAPAARREQQHASHADNILAMRRVQHDRRPAPPSRCRCDRTNSWRPRQGSPPV